jgi:proline iminopeptidase
MVSSLSLKHGMRIDTKIEKVKERNRAYYAKFPEDAERVRKIVKYLEENKVTLSSGYLTPSRFQQLGIVFGFHGKRLSRNDINIASNIYQVVSILCMVSQS